MKSFANKPIGLSKVIWFTFTTFLGDSGIGKTFKSFKNVHRHRRCGRFSVKEVCKTYSFAVYLVLHATSSPSIQKRITPVLFRALSRTIFENKYPNFALKQGQ